MGPEGGSGGGTVVAEGTPEDVVHIAASHTGQFLRHMLPDAPPATKAKTKAKAKPTTKAKAAAQTPAARPRRVRAAS
jgi:excinuclease ABC subunit A